MQRLKKPEEKSSAHPGSRMRQRRPLRQQKLELRSATTQRGKRAQCDRGVEQSNKLKRMSSKLRAALDVPWEQLVAGADASRSGVIRRSARRQQMVGHIGLEPITNGLRVRCSTN